MKLTKQEYTLLKSKLRIHRYALENIQDKVSRNNQKIIQYETKLGEGE
jgi:hypothetical protein